MLGGYVSGTEAKYCYRIINTYSYKQDSRWFLNTYIHTYIYTYIHTYTHIHIRTWLIVTICPCDLILYRAWQPALEAMQSWREGRDQRHRMRQRGMYVCMHVYYCMSLFWVLIISCPCFVYRWKPWCLGPLSGNWKVTCIANHHVNLRGHLGHCHLLHTGVTLPSPQRFHDICNKKEQLRIMSCHASCSSVQYNNIVLWL